MKRPLQGRLWMSTAITIAGIAALSLAPVHAVEVPGRQCTCVTRPLDETVRDYLTAENEVPIRPWSGLGHWSALGNVTVTTRYFILGTMMDSSVPALAGQQFHFPEMDRFRVDGSWARPPVRREIGRTVNVSRRHGICDVPRYRIGQQYLLYVGLAGDTLINMIGCGVVHPSDSARTRTAIALLDSVLKRR